MLDVPTFTFDGERLTTSGSWQKYTCTIGVYELTAEDTYVRYYQGPDGSKLAVTQGRFIPRDASREIVVREPHNFFWYYIPAGGKLNVAHIRRYPLLAE